MNFNFFIDFLNCLYVDEVEAATRTNNRYCTVLYCTVLFCTVLYCTVLYCTVLLTILPLSQHCSPSDPLLDWPPSLQLTNPPYSYPTSILAKNMC